MGENCGNDSLNKYRITETCFASGVQPRMRGRWEGHVTEWGPSGYVDLEGHE